MKSYEEYVDLGGKEHYVHLEGGMFLDQSSTGHCGYSHCDFIWSDMHFYAHSNHKNILGK